jgi:hypothetical protein
MEYKLISKLDKEMSQHICQNSARRRLNLATGSGCARIMFSCSGDEVVTLGLAPLKKMIAECYLVFSYEA